MANKNNERKIRKMEAIEFDKNGQPILTDHEKEIVFEFIERFIDNMSKTYRKLNNNWSIVQDLTRNGKGYSQNLCEALGVYPHGFTWEENPLTTKNVNFKKWIWTIADLYGCFFKIRIENKTIGKTKWCLLNDLWHKRWTKNYVVVDWETYIDKLGENGRIVLVTIKEKKETKE